MNILLINGSPRKGETYKTLLSFAQKMSDFGHETEVVSVNDYNIEQCRGCYQCFLKGESNCPINDDINELWESIQSCDALVISSPVYALGISGAMKNVIDRIAWHSHRPTIYNKPAVIISTTAGMGTKNVIKQLKWIELLGFRVISSKGYMKYPQKDNNNKTRIAKESSLSYISHKFNSSMIKKANQKPSLIRVIQFNALKINAMLAPEVYIADNNYYKNKDFFVNAKINPLKRIMGQMFFKIGSNAINARVNF